MHNEAAPSRLRIPRLPRSGPHRLTATRRLLQAPAHRIVPTPPPPRAHPAAAFQAAYIPAVICFGGGYTRSPRDRDPAVDRACRRLCAAQEPGAVGGECPAGRDCSQAPACLGGGTAALMWLVSAPEAGFMVRSVPGRGRAGRAGWVGGESSGRGGWVGGRGGRMGRVMEGERAEGVERAPRLRPYVLCVCVCV